MPAGSAYVFFRSLLFFCSGVGLMVVSLAWGGWNAVFWCVAVEVDGVVIDQPYGGYFKPRVEFPSESGVKWEDQFNTFLPVRIGDTVPVLHLPGDPSTSQLGTVGAMVVPPVGLFGMGIAFLTVAIGTLITAARPDPVLRSLPGEDQGHDSGGAAPSRIQSRSAT